MELTTEDGTVIRDCTTSQLRAALAKLGARGNGYAILADAPEHYIQVAGNDAEGFVVEYREGSEENHHASIATNLPREQIVEVMTAYLGRASWKGMIAWQSGFGSKGPPSEPDRKVRAIIALLLLIAVVFVVAGVREALATRQFMERAVEVRGHIVQILPNSHARIVEYQDLQGSTHRVEWPHRRAYSADRRVGDYAQVLYDPTDPASAGTARIATFNQVWGGCLVMLLIGIGGVCISSVFGWVEFRRSR
jgi:uncharacterized protein DUF3592